ncbi:MAG: hypothetical protein KGH85_09185, partial [Thaumarchaeota archaeon]|nr:hypothetical protein [Nitrososphaerota archaeon]
MFPVVQLGFDILPEVLKSISKNTGRLDDIDSIEATAESLILSKPLPDTIVPDGTIVTGDVPTEPKYNFIVVLEKEVIPSCCWKD